MEILIRGATSLTRQGLAPMRCLRSSYTSTNTLVGVAASLVLPGASVVLCEDKGGKGGFFDSVVQKDKNGDTDWAKSVTQFGRSNFWDNLAQASGDKIQSAYDTGIPSQLSYGFVMGYCSGYALKKIGKGTAVVCGLGFMSIQMLSYNGYIQVDHQKIQKDFENAMDLNKDGKVDKDDAKIAYDNLMEKLQFGLPAGGGFAGGFIAGVRSG